MSETEEKQQLDVIKIGQRLFLLEKASHQPVPNMTYLSKLTMITIYLVILLFSNLIKDNFISN